MPNSLVSYINKRLYLHFSLISWVPDQTIYSYLNTVSDPEKLICKIYSLHPPVFAYLKHFPSSS